MTLLEKALAVPVKPRNGPSRQTNAEVVARVELAIAFFEGRVSLDQARFALDRKADKNLSTRMGSIIGSAIRRGLVTVAMRPEAIQQRQHE